MTAKPSRTCNTGQAGFTYFGLLALVAILGLMSAASLNAGAILQRRDREAELLFVGSQFRDAFKHYREATPLGGNPYPASLDDLVWDRRFPGTRRHLRKIFIDPLTGSADWGIVPAPGGGIAGIFSRAEGRPIKIGRFPPEFALFAGKESYADWIFFYVPSAPAPLPVPTGNPQTTGRGLS